MAKRSKKESVQDKVPSVKTGSLCDLADELKGIEFKGIPVDFCFREGVIYFGIKVCDDILKGSISLDCMVMNVCSVSGRRRSVSGMRHISEDTDVRKVFLGLMNSLIQSLGAL